MDIFPIWKSTFYESDSDSVKFRILKWGVQEICRATAVRLPDDELLRIGLNKPCQNFLDSNIDVSATGTTSSNAYAEFSLQIWNESNSQWFNAYDFAFVNDWSYGEHDAEGSFSEPINGHAAPGQLIPYSVCSTSLTEETICYEEYDNSPYISFNPNEVAFNYSGGTMTLTIFSNGSWYISSITDGFHASQTSGYPGTSTITITADENTLAKIKNGEIQFVTRNEFGTTTASVPITQAAAPAWLNVTSGDGLEFDGHRTTWRVTYETNLDVVYYKIVRYLDTVATGTSSSGVATFEIPESHDPEQIAYRMLFYSRDTLDTGYYLGGAGAIQNALAAEISVYPSETTVYGEGSFTAVVESTYDWSATVPSGITLSQTTGSSGTTYITVSHAEVDDDIMSTVTFTTNGVNATTDTATLVVDRRVKNYAGDYLTLEVVSGDTLTILHRGKTQGGTAYIEYSLDNGASWQYKWFIDPTPGSHVNRLAINNLYSGSTVLLRADFREPNLRLYVSTEGNASFNVKGNALSLVYGNSFSGQTTMPSNCNNVFSGFFAGSSVINAKYLAIPAVTDGFCQSLFEGCTHLVTPPPLPSMQVGAYTYAYMFNGCTSLAYAPALPATTLGNYCYASMFRRSLITTAPSLPATILKKGCYANMFLGCDSLVNTQNILPAAKLENECYSNMFASCPSLVTAPTIAATTLATDCCNGMFYGCTSLVNVQNTLPATTLADRCYEDMFYRCTSLVNAPQLPATTLADSCYTSMFYRCTSLRDAPQLPATELKWYCYSHMFDGCTSLRTCPDLPATKLQGYCCRAMFYGCTSLVKAPELPATVAEPYCYMEMLSGCVSLMTPPELPATTLSKQCYKGMFKGCSHLNSAPALPATVIAESCYEEMFAGCTSISESPVLPADRLHSGCYLNMFSGCTGLSYVRCLATWAGFGEGTRGWMKGVQQEGMFVRSGNTSWVRGENGIPDGWTIVNA